ncbi:MAG TPA: carboxypeptidase-like regulatory domain-containing protein, partial [Candidatus Acidoferrales bacterium]
MNQTSAGCSVSSQITAANAFRIGRTRFTSVVTAFLAVLLLLGVAIPVRADSISGTVKDPSGAVVVGARIEISGASLAQPLVLASDATGKFTVPDLEPGKYSVHVTKDGFEDLTVAIDLSGAADLPLNLVVAAQQTSVTVTGKASGFANSDPGYRQLRDVGLGESFRCENFRLPMD